LCVSQCYDSHLTGISNSFHFFGDPVSRWCCSQGAGTRSEEAAVVEA
jgi:hypothetical protein